MISTRIGYNLLILIILMTTKQLLGVLIVSSALGYYHYENNQTPDTNVVVVPNDKPKVVPENKPKVGLLFTEVDKHRNIQENTVYGDVLSHSLQEPYGDQDSRRINVHETSHGITSELRNMYQKALGKKINVFYVLKSRCIVLEESNISMHLVTKYIPPVLRSYRYNLYFVKNIVDWNDMPSYIIDEWNSYILGSMSAVEDYNNGILKERVDAVSGCLDFSIYAACFALTVKKHDKEYWDSYPQFKYAIKFLLIQAEKTYSEGNLIANFRTQSQDKLLSDLQNHPDAAELRNFLVEEFDGIFVNKKKD